MLLLFDNSVKKAKKATSVNSFICLLICFFMVQCAVKKKKLVNNSVYEVKRFKTFDSFGSYINIKVLDNSLKESIPALVKINGLYFSKRKIFEADSGKYDIGVYFVGLFPLELSNLNLKKGDSIVINTYLKEDTRPLH